MSNFEDSVLDFDLNYFLPPSDTPSKTPSDKLRKQLVLVKKKTVAINVLIKTHHAYRDTLEEKEVTLLTAKKECTQACIKYQETLEKCTNLEKEVQTLTKQNAELESRCTLSQNQYEGMKSHANQLQSLIKENESVIEALKVEKQHLEKNNSDNRQKNLSSKHEKVEVILKHLSIAKDIALGKKKLRKHHKKLLENYDYLKNVSSEDDSSSDSGSGQPDFFDDSPHSPLPTLPEDTAGANIEHDVFKLNKTEICIKKDSVKQNEDNNSDSSNEVVSEDTGRGSSLTFSDGEKCINSPDYFSNNSPITKEASQVCERKILVDSGTSPIRSPDIIHMATSPCIFDDEVLLSDSNTLFRSETDANNLEYFITDVPLSNEIVTIKEKRKLIDIGTSPIKDLEKVNIATSPLLFEEYVEENVREAFSTSEAPDYQTNHVNGQCQSDNNVRKTPCILTDDTVIGAKGRHITIDNLANLCEVEISGKSIEERKCLERNNSIILCDENSNNNDGEIEMILNTMRLTHSLITPIPETPVNIRKNESRNVQEIVQQKSDNLEKDQYKIMQADIDKLKKELADVKRFVNYPLSNYDKSRIEISNESNISVDTEIFDDTSQETIIINANDDNSNIGNEESEITNFNFSNVLRNDVSQVIEYDKLKEAIPSSTSTLHDIPQIDEPHFSNVLRNDVSQVIEYDTLKEAIPSSTSTLHDIPQIDEPPTIDITIEKEYKAVSVNNAIHVTKNDSREAITFEEDLISEDENDITINNGVNHSLQDVSIVCSKPKISRNKNLSKLDKFKQKLLPKSKISTTPTRKLRSKSKLIPVVKLTKMDAIAILNNKSAYENAAKVMAEIKSKEKDLANKQRITRKVIRKVRDKNDNKDLEQQQHRNEESNPKKHIRRKLNDQQCEKPAESIEDSQLDFSPTTARNRTCKLSINYCESPLSIIYCESPIGINYRESPIQICTSKKETSKSEEQRKRLKRRSTDSPIVSPKRVLRSSNKRNTFVDLGTVKNDVSNNETDFDSPNRRNYKLSSEEQNISDNVENVSDTHKNIKGRKFSKSENEAQNNKVSSSPSKIQNPKLSKSDNEEQLNKIKTVSDSPNKILDHKISNVDNAIEESNKSTEVNDDDQLVSQISHPKQSILCRMLEKHARGDVKSSCKKVPDHITNSICKKLEDGIASINELPPIKVKAAMNKFVNEVQSWDVKHFMLGFIKYLKNPDRKRELFNKVNSPPAPPMTKSEQVLLYVVKQMETRTPNTVHVILTHIEFSLFQLNRTPEFDIIESLSHFYALLCRYFGLKSRLRLFLLDAMYCVQFKAVPIVKQCLDVWMHILPLAHLGIAKSPLVTCLVYLLHFYKCKDGFNRVQEIRNILSRKYFYEMTDLNETKILEMFKSAITDMRDIPIEKKMLRSALIILGKRHGAKWCHKNIIKNILMPMIEREDVSMKIKQFCVQLLGALLKPFPGDMKVHFEIAANHLHEMLQQDPPDAMKEAIFTSLIYINHQNPNRVIRSLLSWMPKQVSPEFEQLLRDYVRGKPLRVWKKILSKITM